MPEQDCIFISDVHLGAFDSIKEQEIESDLIALIKYCCENEIKIFLLGDLFDYWMEYPKKEFIPTHGEKVLNAFKEYNITCKPSTFITGNHDNWTFGHFENIGFDVEPNYRIVKLNGYKVLLMHGDGKFGKRDDLLRPFWHGLLRSSWFIKIFQFLFPPKIGLWIMKRFSGFSKLNDLRTPVPLNNHAKRILKEKDIDHILMGHDHIPRTEIFESGTYINLGTFFHHRSLALYTNKDLKLVTWSASKKEFVPYDKSTAKA